MYANLYHALIESTLSVHGGQGGVLDSKTSCMWLGAGNAWRDLAEIT